MRRTEAAPPDAGTPPVPAVDWEAVRRGCPCGTCEAARRGEMGHAPAGARAESAPEDAPARRLADLEARLEARLQEMEGRLRERLEEGLARVAERIDALEERLGPGREEAPADPLDAARRALAGLVDGIDGGRRPHAPGAALP